MDHILKYNVHMVTMALAYVLQQDPLLQCLVNLVAPFCVDQ